MATRAHILRTRTITRPRPRRKISDDADVTDQPAVAEAQDVLSVGPSPEEVVTPTNPNRVPPEPNTKIFLGKTVPPQDGAGGDFVKPSAPPLKAAGQRVNGYITLPVHPPDTATDCQQLSELFRNLIIKDADSQPGSQENSDKSIGEQSAWSGRSKMRMDQEEPLLEMRRHETEQHCQVAVFQKASCAVLTYAKVVGMISMMTNTRIVRDDDPNKAKLMQFKIYGGEADCKKAVDCMVDRLLTQEDERNNNYDRIRPKTKSTARSTDFNHHCKREKLEERPQKQKVSRDERVWSWSGERFDKYRDQSPSFPTTDSESQVSSRTVSLSDDLDKPSIMITFNTNNDTRQCEVPQMGRHRLASSTSSTDTDSLDEPRVTVKSKVVKMYRQHSAESDAVSRGSHSPDIPQSGHPVTVKSKLVKMYRQHSAELDTASHGSHSSDIPQSIQPVTPGRRRRCTIGRSMSEPLDNRVALSDANNNSPAKSPGVYGPLTVDMEHNSRGSSPCLQSPGVTEVRTITYKPSLQSPVSPGVPEVRSTDCMPNVQSPVSPGVPVVRTTFSALKSRVNSMKCRRQLSLPQEDTQQSQTVSPAEVSVTEEPKYTSTAPAAGLRVSLEDVKSPADHLPGWPAGPAADQDFHLTTWRGSCSPEDLQPGFPVTHQPDSISSSSSHPSPQAAHPTIFKREPLFKSAAPVHKCPALAKRRQQLRAQASTQPTPAMPPTLTIKMPEVLKAMMTNDSTLKDLPQISEVEVEDLDTGISSPEGARHFTFHTEAPVAQQSVILTSPSPTASSRVTRSDPDLNVFSSPDSASVESCTPGLARRSVSFSRQSTCSSGSVLGDDVAHCSSPIDTGVEDQFRISTSYCRAGEYVYERSALIKLLASPYSWQVPRLWQRMQDDFPGILLNECHGLDPPPMTFERRWKGRHNSEGQQHSEGRHHSEGQKDNPFAISSNNAQWKTWTPNSA